MFQHTNIYNNLTKLINSSSIHSIQFFPTGSEENEQLGNVKLINKEMFRGQDPIRGGAYDKRMGTTEPTYNCELCLNTKLKCPGHMGYIKLRYPVKNPFFRDKLLKWLKVCCFECGYPITKKKINAPSKQLLSEYVKSCRTISKCAHCGAKHSHVIKDKHKTLQFYKVIKDDNVERKDVFYNHQIKNVINRIPDEVVKMMKKPLTSHPKKFILDTILASPNTIRPDIRKVGGKRSNNNDITTFLKNIIAINDSLPLSIPDLTKFSEEDKSSESLTRKYYNLDQHVYDMIRGSSASSAQYKVLSSTSKNLVSIAQRFPKKVGRYRKNINGKRVFNAARSVITGDPMMPINVVGIPMHVATTIQIPEIVQPYNIESLNAIFMNRRDSYPGWSSLIKAIDGKRYSSSKLPSSYKIQNGDILYRDIIDDDPVCFGRQPSLETSSISGFKVKILKKESTFRMNVSSCSFFNADSNFRVPVC